METNFNLIAYIIYLPITIIMTVLVSNLLFKNGKIFMQDIFNQKIEIANATNSLFKIGFYLLNIGFAMAIIHMYQISNTENLIVSLSTKIGGFAIYLGIMLMLNLFLFMKGRSRALNKNKENSIETI